MAEDTSSQNPAAVLQAALELMGVDYDRDVLNALREQMEEPLIDTAMAPATELQEVMEALRRDYAASGYTMDEVHIRTMAEAHIESRLSAYNPPTLTPTVTPVPTGEALEIPGGYVIEIEEEDVFPSGVQMGPQIDIDAGVFTITNRDGAGRFNGFIEVQPGTISEAPELATSHAVVLNSNGMISGFIAGETGSRLEAVTRDGTVIMPEWARQVWAAMALMYEDYDLMALDERRIGAFVKGTSTLYAIGTEHSLGRVGATVQPQEEAPQRRRPMRSHTVSNEDARSIRERAANLARQQRDEMANQTIEEIVAREDMVIEQPGEIYPTRGYEIEDGPQKLVAYHSAPIVQVEYGRRFYEWKDGTFRTWAEEGPERGLLEDHVVFPNWQSLRHQSVALGVRILVVEENPALSPVSEERRLRL